MHEHVCMWWHPSCSPDYCLTPLFSVGARELLEAIVRGDPSISRSHCLITLRSVTMLLDESKTCICSICQVDIASKTKLFKHLEDFHGMTNPNAKPCKCVLLVGWLATAQAVQVTGERQQELGFYSPHQKSVLNCR